MRWKIFGGIVSRFIRRICTADSPDDDAKAAARKHLIKWRPTVLEVVDGKRESATDSSRDILHPESELPPPPASAIAAG